MEELICEYTLPVVQAYMAHIQVHHQYSPQPVLNMTIRRSAKDNLGKIGNEPTFSEKSPKHLKLVYSNIYKKITRNLL